jgi:glycosyltransferase involved in cell wall biosynthesis
MNGATGGSRAAVVVPCFNEARRLRRESFFEFLTNAPAADLLFVDDGSSDATWDVLQELAEMAPGHVMLLRRTRNGGKGEAVREGMLALMERGYAIVGFWDADLATPLSEVRAFLDLMSCKPAVDWVIGARVKLLGRRIERRPLRHYLGRVFATAASMALDCPVYDTQCGAKLFRASAELRAVLATPFQSRWIFDVEMIWRLGGLRGATGLSPERTIYEMPLPEWHDVRGSKVRARDFVRAAADLVRIRLAPRPAPATLPPTAASAVSEP